MGNLSLEKEYTYFKSILPELMKESYGKYAVISDNTLIGIYESREQALKENAPFHKLGTFLVQQIVGEEEIPTFYSYRAIFV